VSISLSPFGIPKGCCDAGGAPLRHYGAGAPDNGRYER
jgi:hypothetical protein